MIASITALPVGAPGRANDVPLSQPGSGRVERNDEHVFALQLSDARFDGGGFGSSGGVVPHSR